MTVEDRSVSVGNDEPKDRFPVGMRVLAVDDDPICLKLLDTLLRRCQYHVTTTSQAIMALKLLRENRNNFDLVISDVHMPDMDGFKLLELVGLDMDLPVIMLSANSDTEVVMKGITHGAVDYLVKPVRIEELKIIWKHVIRRRKFDSTDQNNPNNLEKTQGSGECAQGNPGENADKNAKQNRKRKDQNDDEDDDCEDNGNENEDTDTATQKKPRVVWSVELHRKFVAAVNQLGVDKAVPKRILDMMNVERLTRENVASHLQKYRLYLKRISFVSQQANMVAALGGKDPSYLRMGSLDGFGDFCALNGSGQLPNAAFTSLPPAGMLGRLNSPAGLGMRGLAPSGMIQLGQARNSGTPISDLGKLWPVVLSGNQNGNLLQGMPTSLELDQLQQNKCISRIGEFSGHVDEQTVFPVASGFSDNALTIGSSSNSFLTIPNNSMMLQGQPQQTQNRGLGNQSSVSVALRNPEPFDVGACVSSHVSDQSRCNDKWQSAVPLIGFQSNSLPSSTPFSHADLSPSNLAKSISLMGSHSGNNPHDISSTSVVSAPLQDSRRAVECQASVLIGNNIQNGSPKFSNFGGLSNNLDQNMNYAPMQRWEDHKQDYTHNSNLLFSSINSAVPTHGVISPLTQNLVQNNAVCSRNVDTNLFGQSNAAAPYLMLHNEVENSAVDTAIKLKEEYSMEHTKPQGGFISNSCGSLEDLMAAMIKQGQQEVKLMDGDIEGEVYPLRTCM